MSDFLRDDKQIKAVLSELDKEVAEAVPISIMTMKRKILVN